jgi:hypothetical protein
MVTGCVPFSGSMTEVLLAHRSKKAPLAHEVDASVPPMVSRLISQMMSKNPDVRPQIMSDVAARLEELIERRQNDARREFVPVAIEPTRRGFPFKPIGIWIGLASVTFGVGFLFGKAIQMLFS